MFINKNLRLNNLKTRIEMNAKISTLLFVLKQSYICYYLKCMTVPLSKGFGEKCKPTVWALNFVQKRYFS